MTLAKQNRRVECLVDVYRCNRCGAEAVTDALNGWMHLCVLELRPAPPSPFGGPMPGLALAQQQNSEQHLCPRCAVLVLSVASERPAPEMIGNDIANIPLRTNDGGTVMLTRFEYDRWVEQGKPPILSSQEVKS